MMRTLPLLAALLLLPALPAASAENVCLYNTVANGCLEAAFDDSATSGYVFLGGSTPVLEGGVKGDGGYAGGVVIVTFYLCTYDEVNGWQCEEQTYVSRDVCDNPLAICP